MIVVVTVAVVVVVVLAVDEYHEKEMTEKKLDKVKMANSDICHDRPTPSSFTTSNGKNKNKNMRTPPTSIKRKQGKYMGNDRVRMVEAAMMLMMRMMMREKEIEERVSLLEDANNYVVKNCI
jgi:hypothetical protein